MSRTSIRYRITAIKSWMHSMSQCPDCIVTPEYPDEVELEYQSYDHEHNCDLWQNVVELEKMLKGNTKDYGEESWDSDDLRFVNGVDTYSVRCVPTEEEKKDNEEFVKNYNGKWK